MTVTSRDDYDRAWERDRWRRRQAKIGRVAKPRQRMSPEDRAARRQAKREALQAERDAQPFVGCDGEGIGRQPDAHYALFRMGDRELYRGGRRLTTPELLAFIVNHPDPAAILVAFAFNYDASNILFDVPRIRDRPRSPSRFERLFLGSGNAWTWLDFDGFPTFGVHYRAGNHLKVCHGMRDPRNKSGGDGRLISRPGSIRVIYDTWGFFQGSFLAALNKWEIGSEAEWQIREMKAARESFDAITPEIRDYCALECKLLADLMTEFRHVCIDLDMRPKTWNGAGKLASAILDQHGALTRKQVETTVSKSVLDMAMHAYYGGRFEITRVGYVGGNRTRKGRPGGGGPVWEHDISSAYPAAMIDLPCLEHGRWRKASAEELQKSLVWCCRSECTSAGHCLYPDFCGLTALRTLFVCPATFTHPRDQFLCGLPFRSREGTLAWPRAGNGTYWSVELRSAMRLGATIECRDGYVFEPGDCNCKPFAWVDELYRERQAIGKARRGIPIKLGLNSLYGKHAQRIGTPKYANPITAGLITAITRAKLNDAIVAAGQRNVVMIATDAIYTLGDPAPHRDKPGGFGLDFGDGLGQWERKCYPSLFIVRPGLYWPPKPRGEAWKIKSKGLSPKFFEPRVPDFQRLWRDYCREGDATRPSPSLTITTVMFVGLRYAWRIARPELACQWIEHPIEVRFGDRAEKGGNKREGCEWALDGRSLIMGSKGGNPSSRSKHYDRKDGRQAAGWLGDMDHDHDLLDAMPDPVDLTPPWVE